MDCDCALRSYQRAFSCVACTSTCTTCRIVFFVCLSFAGCPFVLILEQLLASLRVPSNTAATLTYIHIGLYFAAAVIVAAGLSWWVLNASPPCREPGCFMAWLPWRSPYWHPAAPMPLFSIQKTLWLAKTCPTGPTLVSFCLADIFLSSC